MQVSALPPREGLEALNAIADPADRRKVARALPADVFSNMIGESMVENLNRNVREEMAQRNPTRAA